MATFNKQYDERLIDIMSNGVSNEGQNVRTVWKDGKPAYTRAVWHRVMRFKPEDGFPILTKKYVNPKSFSSEILWIMQKASNVVEDARELGTSVWDEWENEEGTIGKSYGYQIANNTYRVYLSDISHQSFEAMGKKAGTTGLEDYSIFVDIKTGKKYIELNQIDYVIHQLIDNPYSRQTVTTLMNPKEHHDMELPPCVWTSHWEVLGGKLQLAVTARSSDTFLGFPFNVSQYALLHRLIGHVTGWSIGDFVITTEDTHLYDRHIPIAMEYLEREEKRAPKFWLDESIKSFQDFEYGKSFGWLNYRKEDYEPLRAPIAIGRDEYERLKRNNK